MREAIYPGSFDPVTTGHLDIIRRGAEIFDKVTVAVLINVDKKGFFTVDERVIMLEEVTKEFDNVEIISFSGLLVDLLNERNNPVILKGLRNSTDFDYEMQMDILNKMLEGKAETMYMISKMEYCAISSSAVKQIVRFGGNIEGMVPSIVLKNLKEKLSLV